MKIESRPYSRLLDAIVQLYRARQEGAPGASMLHAAAEFLAAFDADRFLGGTATRKPVCRHLPAAVFAARNGPLGDLADAFIAIEPMSDWRQNPNYTEDTIGGAFLTNYGYVELVGPARPVASDTFLIGLLLLGPDTLYPDHSHAAAEVYHVIAGAADWWREDQGWTVLPAGAVIVHAPSVRHATRTRGEPMLALYCWRGEIATAARLREPLGDNWTQSRRQP